MKDRDKLFGKLQIVFPWKHLFIYRFLPFSYSWGGAILRMNIFFPIGRKKKGEKNPAHAMGNLGEKLGLRPPQKKNLIHIGGR